MVNSSTDIANLPLSTLIRVLGPNLEFARELAPLTSYRTGGRARYFVSAESAHELAHAISGARQLSLPFFVIGGGSNLLVSDDGYDGLIIKVDVRGIGLVEPSLVECGAGEDLMALVDFATAHSLTGIEFLAGIWGSVGGAIYGNAGAFGGEIGNVITQVTLVDRQGNIREADHAYCRFGYRDSFLKETHEVVINARMKLAPGDQRAISGKVNEILALRHDKHPNDGLSAGCFFKNIPDPKEKYGKLPAGRLLEQVGAKTMSVGGARVFERHANIIVNSGNATSRDIRQLADLLKQKVKDRFGIELQEEVQQLGSFQ